MDDRLLLAKLSQLNHEKMDAEKIAGDLSWDKMKVYRKLKTLEQLGLVAKSVTINFSKLGLAATFFKVEGVSSKDKELMFESIASMPFFFNAIEFVESCRELAFSTLLPSRYKESYETKIKSYIESLPCKPEVKVYTRLAKFSWYDPYWLTFVPYPSLYKVILSSSGLIRKKEEVEWRDDVPGVPVKLEKRDLEILRVIWRRDLFSVRTLYLELKEKGFSYAEVSRRLNKIRCNNIAYIKPIFSPIGLGDQMYIDIKNDEGEKALLYLSPAPNVFGKVLKGGEYKTISYCYLPSGTGYRFADMLLERLGDDVEIRFRKLVTYTGFDIRFDLWDEKNQTFDFSPYIEKLVLMDI